MLGTIKEVGDSSETDPVIPKAARDSEEKRPQEGLPEAGFKQICGRLGYEQYQTGPTLMQPRSSQSCGR